MYKIIANFMDGIFRKILSGRKLFERNEEIIKSVYSDFTPTDNIEKGAECLGALEWALSNKKIMNIALTGPYGAGKSSVISTYLNKHPKCPTINISMATFDGYTLEKITELKQNSNVSEAQEYANKLEDELERGILKQLFYKVNSDKIPLSRYRKLHNKSLLRYISFILGMCLIIIAVMYLAMPNKVIDFIADYFKNGVSSSKKIVAAVISLLVTIVGLAYAIRLTTSRFKIKEISVGDTTVQGETQSTESILNKNMDEILYFFERTNYGVVFIEDLDRFNDTSIFIKLREINGILNNYDAIKRRIVFVYAVKDDLFSNETERTKFFDFVIPVIPVINTTNSGEIMRDLLGLGNEKKDQREYPKHNITARYITLVSPYIGDMRVLLSTVNEFWMYRRTLKDAQDVQLNDENMFSLMIYKNLYPRDFALLEAESGDVKSVFLNKKSAINDLQTELKEKRKLLDCKEKDSLNSIKELKIIILSEIIGCNGVVTRIEVANQSINYPQLLADDYSFDTLKKSSLWIYYRPYNEQYERSIQINNPLESIDGMKELFYRYDVQCTFHNKKQEEILKEIENNSREISNLRANTIKQLIEKYSIETVLPESVRKNDLLIFLLRHGYIDESYADYINHFHPGSITKDELNFILSIRNFRSLDDFSYQIKHCANVCDRLEDYEFEQVEALNFSITDFLLDSNTNKEKLQKLIKQLTNRQETSLIFIKAYFDRGVHIERFMQVLCHNSNHIWEDLLGDDQLSRDKKDSYLKLIIDSCEIDDIKKNNIIDYEENEDGDFLEIEIITKYIESDKNILQKMSDIAWSKMKNVIETLGIVFRQLKFEGLETEIVEYIIEEWRFELNPYMMKEIFQIKKPECVDALFNANYRHVRELGCDALLEYIYDDFSSYVQSFIIGEESNIEETTEDVEDIIERLYNKSKDLCIKVIEKEYLAKWDSLTACLCGYEDKEKQEIWDYLLVHNRTSISWNNYLTYRGVFGLTSVLLTFVDSNIDFLLQSQGDEILTDERIKELLIANLSDDSFKKFITNYPVEEFTNECSEFSEEKLKIMIIEHYFSFTSERYLELREISRMLGKEFVKENKTEFLNFIDTCKITIEDLKDFIKLGIFNEKETLLLFEYISVEDVDVELALIIRSFDFLMPKVFIETTWNLLTKEDKYQLLLNQLEIYGLDELAIKFDELGGVYGQFTERSKHKYSLMASDYNIKLCEKLHSMDFLSSKEVIAEKVGFDPIGLKDKMESHVVGYVKRKV